MELPVLFGICKTGGFISLLLISSNESCCSFPQLNGLPFLVKSYIGFNSFCSSGQKILRKVNIPAKLLHPLGVLVVEISESLLICFLRVAQILSYFL